MARSRAPARSPLESLLDALQAESSLPGALDAALDLIATHGAAEAAAVLLYEDGRALEERWHPKGWTPPPLLAEEVRAAARARAAEAGKGGLKRRPPGWRILPLLANGRVLGALCLGPARRALRRGRELERMAGALASRAAAELEVGRSRALQSRYERWFKTLDEQLRVLDRERQKFASFVKPPAPRCSSPTPRA